MKLIREGKTAVWIAAALIAALLALMGNDSRSSASQDEKRMAEVLSAIAGAGRVEVALFYAPEASAGFAQSDEAGAPTGAVIVAEGADDWQVRLQLIRAARTLLGLPEAAVDVFAMEGTK